MSAVNFKYVRVDRYLGIGRTEQALVLEDLKPGLNVVWAPNGRGKTCTARAMIGLLWGQGIEARWDDIEARMEIDGDEVERSTQSLLDPLPNLPPLEISGLYRMSLPELLEGRDEDLVQRIRQELHGNIDLADAAARLDFTHATPGRNLSEYRQARACRENLDETIRNQRAVEEKRQGLDQLRRERDALESDLALKECYRQQLELSAAVAARQDAEAQLLLFPAGMDNLRAGDKEDLDGSLADFQAAGNALAEKGRALDATNSRLADTGFGEKGPPDKAWRDSAGLRVEALRNAESELKSWQRQKQEAETRHKEARSLLEATDRELDAVKAAFRKAPEQASLDAINSLYEETSRLKREYEEIEDKRSASEREVHAIIERIEPMISAADLQGWLAGGMPIIDFSGAIRQAAAIEAAAKRAVEAERECAKTAEELARVKAHTARSHRAVELLRRAVIEQTERKSEPLSWPLLAVISGLPSILIVVLGLLLSPWCFAALLLPLALSVFLSLRSRARSSADPERTRRELQESGIEPAPHSWQTADLLECLQEQQRLLLERDSLQSAADRSQERMDAVRQELNDLRAGQAGQVRQLAENMDLRLDGWDAGKLFQLVDLLGDLRESRNEQEQLAHLLSEKLERMKAVRENLKAKLGEFIDEPGEELSHMLADISRLGNAVHKLTELAAAESSRRHNLQSASRKLASAEENLKVAEAERRKSLHDLHMQLEAWHESPASLADFALARPAVDGIIGRAEEYERLGLEIMRLEREIAATEKSLADKAARIDGWLAIRHLPVGEDNRIEARNQLAIRLELLDEYNRLKTEKINARARIDTARARLEREGCPTRISDLKNAELERWLESVDQREAQADSARKEIAQIENEIRGIQENDALEKANAEYQAALGELARKREESRAESIGDLLVADLEQRAELSDSPAVGAARDFFAAFSRDRYGLDVSGADCEIAARDNTHSGRRIPIEQLSSGTRVQLLLAARLGFLSAQEGEAYNRPPFILDEALAVSDDERSAAIMDAVRQLIGGGRQVFYFTAQSEEVDRWKAHLGDADAGLFCIHAIGTPPAPLTVPAARWQPAEIPAPEADESYADYCGRLQVPPLAPWGAGAAAAHISHLHEQPGLLHRCLRIVGPSCGALMAYLDRVGLERAAERLQCEPAELEKARMRYAMLERALQHYRHRRPRPLELEQLKEINDLPGIGKTAADGLAQLIREENGNADRVLQRASEFQGFGDKRREALKDYLIRNAYLDTGESYSPDDIARLLRQEFGDSMEVDRIAQLVDL